MKLIKINDCIIIEGTIEYPVSKISRANLTPNVNFAKGCQLPPRKAVPNLDRKQHAQGQ